MSLLDSFAHSCVILEKRRVNDGEGGYAMQWMESVEFSLYQARDTSMEARRAEAEGVTSVYSAMVDKEVPIEYNDYYRDKETGLTYRVTSIPEEKQAPETASPAIAPLKFFTAERKDLPG